MCFSVNFLSFFFIFFILLIIPPPFTRSVFRSWFFLFLFCRSFSWHIFLVHFYSTFISLWFLLFFISLALYYFLLFSFFSFGLSSHHYLPIFPLYLISLESHIFTAIFGKIRFIRISLFLMNQQIRVIKNLSCSLTGSHILFRVSNSYFKTLICWSDGRNQNEQWQKK